MPDLPEIPGLNTPATSWPDSGFKGGVTPTGWTQERIDAYRQQIIELILRQVVLALRNTLNPGKAFDQLRDWADTIGDEFVDQIRDNAGIDLSSWDAFVASLDDDKGIDLPHLANAISALGQLFGGIDLDDPPTPQEVWRLIVRTFIEPLNLLLGPRSPLNPAKLNENLWPLGAFPNAEAVNGSGQWVFDPEVTHSADSTGSVRVVADGTMKALLSAPAAVAEGQQVDLSLFVRWAGYVGSGAPILVQVAEYAGVGDIAQRTGVTTVATLGPSSASGEWTELAETYIAPAGVDEIRLRLLVMPAATAGTFNFDDVVGRNKLVLSWVAELPERLQDLIARFQAIVDSIVQAFTGSNALANKLEDLLFALQNIRPANVVGVLGPGTIGEAIEKLVDSIVSGIVGQDGEGAGLADIREFIEQLSSQSWLGKASWSLLSRRDNKSLNAGLLRSERSNFNLSEINTQFTITPGTSLIAFDIIEESMPIGAISWIGWGTTGITEFYVNVYKVGNLNAVGGTAVLLHQSDNVVGILEGNSSPGAYIRYEVDEPPPAEAGDLLAYELITVGGSHTIRGQSVNLPFDNVAPVGARAATRVVADPDTPPTALTRSDIDWSNDVPWIGIAVDVGDGGDFRDPELQQLTKPTSLPIPNWATHVDVVVLGKGGDAADGFAGFYGNPGSPGSYNTATFVRGVHFAGTSTILTFAGSTVSIPGYSVTANNGAHGVGQRLVGLGQPVGRGPGNLEYNGIKAIGGADQTAFGGDGTTPGGAANGGHWFGIYTQGGKGGAARAWVQFRREAQPGELPSDPDNTPPDISGLSVEVVSATSNSLTIRPSGAVDDA
ncbi:minor tail protein [Mycobacterium phage Shipwreck]|uniref:Minor tail protein n=1 Tax=Mycobacterium phage Shipwreck TaxID=1821727 RepID=A0A143FPH4_9CAUD|nr:minor tail protein [Mycobacterium phage Shipwreck]AMW63839.1 minor tail protein [Mycobacterium phage Shipwreck]